LKAAGIAFTADSGEGELLGEFQRKGYFLSYALECPFEEQDDPNGALRRFAPTVFETRAVDL